MQDGCRLEGRTDLSQDAILYIIKVMIKVSTVNSLKGEEGGRGTTVMGTPPKTDKVCRIVLAVFHLFFVLHSTLFEAIATLRRTARTDPVTRMSLLVKGVYEL